MPAGIELSFALACHVRIDAKIEIRYVEPKVQEAAAIQAGEGHQEEASRPQRQGAMDLRNRERKRKRFSNKARAMNMDDLLGILGKAPKVSSQTLGGKRLIFNNSDRLGRAAMRQSWRA